MAGKSIKLKLRTGELELLRDTIILSESIEEKLRCMVAGKREATFTYEELEELAGYVAGEANHAADRGRQDKLNCICDRIEDLLGEFEEA